MLKVSDRGSSFNFHCLFGAVSRGLATAKNLTEEQTQAPPGMDDAW